MTQEEFSLTSPWPYRKKINTNKVLSIIAQSQHIILSKDLTAMERGILITNSATLLEFIERDNYPKPMLIDRITLHQGESE